MRFCSCLNVPKLLGYAGLLPFIFITAMLWAEPHHYAFWQRVLLSYGAVILTFVGALHWSLAMQVSTLHDDVKRGLYIWSVIPSLVAWLALLLPYKYAYGLLVAFFLLALWRDISLARRIVLSNWYLPLRKTLTVIVVACLLMAYYACTFDLRIFAFK